MDSNAFVGSCLIHSKMEWNNSKHVHLTGKCVFSKWHGYFVDVLFDILSLCLCLCVIITITHY